MIAGCTDDLAGITLPSHTAHPPVKSCYFSTELLMNLEITYFGPAHSAFSTQRGFIIQENPLCCVCKHRSLGEKGARSLCFGSGRRGGKLGCVTPAVPSHELLHGV